MERGMGSHFRIQTQIVHLIGILFLGTFLGGISPAWSDSDQTTKDIEVFGAVDVFYQKNFNGMPVSNGRLFDWRNDVIQLQWASLSVRKNFAPVDVQVDLAFGELTDILSEPNDPTKNVPQAFFAYSPTSLPEFTLQFGKFYTWIGFETSPPMDNWNISRSLTFDYGTPFWHQGLIASYVVWPEALSAGFAFVNGWGGPIADEENKSQTIGGYLESRWVYGLKLRYNVISGIESASENQVRQVHNLIGNYFVDDLMSAGFDLTYGFQSETPSPTGFVYATWLGWSLYGKLYPLKRTSLGLRYEEFSDRNGLPLNLFVFADPLKAQKIQSVTATAAYELDTGVEVRLEYRADKSDVRGLYVSSDGSPSDFQNTLAVEAFAKF